MVVGQIWFDVLISKIPPSSLFTPGERVYIELFIHILCRTQMISDITPVEIHHDLPPVCAERDAQSVLPLHATNPPSSIYLAVAAETSHSQQRWPERPLSLCVITADQWPISICPWSLNLPERQPAACSAARAEGAKGEGEGMQEIERQGNKGEGWMERWEGNREEWKRKDGDGMRWWGGGDGGKKQVDDWD